MSNVSLATSENPAREEAASLPPARKQGRFPFLDFSLDRYDAFSAVLADPTLKLQLQRRARRDRYPLRMTRYWQALEAVSQRSRQLNRTLAIVDLGCERGITRRLAGESIAAIWTGLDYNLGRPGIREAGYDRLLEADFDKPLPLEDGKADVVICQHVFEHLPRPEFTMGEIARVLRPGGIALIGLPVLPMPLAVIREKIYRMELSHGRRSMGRHINRFWPGRVRRMARQAGMTVDWSTGSHFFRWSGSGLENSKIYIRANHLWGGLFPGMGREFYMQVSKRD